MLNEPFVDEKKGVRRGKCRAKGISERERESLTAGPDQGQCGSAVDLEMIFARKYINM